MFIAWILFWAYSWFYIAEISLIVNFFNLTSLYFRHRRAPQFVHIPVVAAPLALTFVMLFWTGAAAIDAHNVVARTFAHLFVWAILSYGLFFTVAFKDYAMGYSLTLLLLCKLLKGSSLLWTNLCVSAFTIQQHKIRDLVEPHGVHLQWVFAFVIAALLFTVTLTFSAPPVLLGKELVFVHHDFDYEGTEHRPLLDHE